MTLPESTNQTTTAPGEAESAAPAPVRRTRRTGPQLLSDEIIADELLDAAGEKKGRLIEANSDIWSVNAWDRVDWDDEQEAIALAAVEQQANVPVPDEQRDLYNANPASFWDSFYANMKDRFFNDRSWLRTEFPVLAEAIQVDAGPKRIVEIGCGPGNTLFPLFAANENPHLQLHGFDYSKEAIDLVLANPAFDPKAMHGQVWDLASKEGLPSSVEPGTVDIAIMIFVLSALHPDEWARAVENTWKMLKPGGVLLFRDYGRHDLAQLRLKGNRYMQPGLYVRGDHTRVYFFERDELVSLFGPPTKQAGTPLSLEGLSLDTPSSSTEFTTTATTTETTTKTATTPPSPFRFELLQLGVDRRLLLNRKKALKMYRIWMQGRWRKPFTATPTEMTT